MMGFTVATLVLPGCHREHRFESVCEILRREVVEEDKNGVPQLIDLELEWDPCPGDQFQVVRGGPEFAACMNRYKVGELIPVHIVHWWDTRGFYTWDLDRLGDCPHRIETRYSEGSFEKSQECKDVKVYGRVDGFSCNRKPFENLVSICPWMARD